MEEAKDSPLMSHFQSKNPFLTTPIKNSSTVQGSAIATPDRFDPNPNTRSRNLKVDLSVSVAGRKTSQVRKPSTVGSDPLKAGPETSSGFGFDQENNGSLSQKSTSILPEKHQILCDFFVAMVNSIRLFRLKGVQATFTKLACNIQSLTNRRFTLHHLAQLKYMVPEVIVTKKIRVQDAKTKCMQEDLLLSIEMDAVEFDKNAKGGAGFSQLKNIFQSRVIDFSKTHPEAVDIPEGELPHLFYQPKQGPESNSNGTSTPLVASLIAPSFKRRFSSKALGGQVSESTAVKQSICLSETPIKKATFCLSETPIKKATFCLSETPIKEATSSKVKDRSSSSTVEADQAPLCPSSTPAKLASIPQKLASTPSELASTPARLMASTPALRTPKRVLMTPDHDTCKLTNKSAKRRSLKFEESSFDIEDRLSRVDEEENVLPAQGSAIAKDDVLAVLPENVFESLVEKEKNIIEEKDPVVSQARRHQQMMAGVPKLFDMIRLLFQSIRRNYITKEELIYKLLSGHMEILDRDEVEEQLKLLQELAPEYISEQISLSGDTLVSLNKYSSVESIRAKLLEAS